MINKKSSKGNLDKRRITFLLIGFVIVFGLVYAGFEFFAPKPKDLGTLPIVVIIEVTENVQATDPTKPPPPPAPQQDIRIKIVENTPAEIDISDLFPEYNPNDVIEPYEPVTLIPEIPDDPPKPVWEMDVIPEPEGGMEGLYAFLRANLKYPRVPLEAGIQGQVFVEFVIEKDGSISNVKVISSVYPDLDNEAVRVVKIMPKWKPGKQQGKAVRCMYNIPIRFAIN
jgi:protein TonB